MADTTQFTIKQGEGKWLNWSLYDKNNNPMPCDTATFKFAVKLKATDAAYLIEYPDENFDKTDAANGNVKVKLLPTDTAGLAGGKTHVCELKIDFGNSLIDKSITINLKVEQAVTHD
jgi:hypothetical protein